MKKTYIKLNNNDEHLSIGNFFRIIKELAKNKISALQTELFCVLFDLEGINDTTVNNYCVGCRGIGSEYKQIYINKKRRYQKEKDVFSDNILGVLSIIDGVLYNLNDNKVAFINKSNSAYLLAKKLYNLAKNDRQVKNDFTIKLHSLLESNLLYECLVEELLFVILEKKQPIREEDLKKEVFENVLNDTSISSIDLQEYLSLKLREGINFDYSMKKLAASGNAYANYELGFNEYYGYVKGFSRYDEAFKYLKIAAKSDHAAANYMIGNMYLKGIIGSRSKEELEKGYQYLVKSSELGNVAALNTIGNMYLNGVYPLDKDQEKAISYYMKAALNKYAYAYNNLGKIDEMKKDYEKAFDYYLKAADLGESWACNKVGEYYRKGIIVKDMEKAFYYYNEAILGNYRTLCYYAYYNLAVYFYKEGYDDIVLKADEDKYCEYLRLAGNNGVIEALVELLCYYIKKYLKERNMSFLDKIEEFKLKIESNDKYNNELREKVEKAIIMLEERKEISWEIIKNL